jgi:hypothetical protein
MANQILDTFCWNVAINSFDNFYVEDVQIKFKQFDRNIILTDIKNAMKTGKDCRAFSLQIDHNQDNCFFWNWIHQFGYDLQKAFDFLCSLPWDNDHKGIELDGFKVYDRTEKAIRVFSPFSKALKPLKEEPNKWTVRHVTRALLNNQFDRLKCHGVYTDDYAHDAAVGFRAGEITNSQDFVKQIIESPSGWWVGTHRENKEISICCHSFDSNSFFFQL